MIAIASLLITFSVPAAPQLDAERMLWAIEQVENTKRAQIGRSGERGTRQLKRTTWAMHSSAPFEWASSERPVARAETARVEREHLRLIRRELKAAGLPDTPWLCALAWKAGITGCTTKRVTRQDLSYADRCRNLYEDKL